MASFTITKRPKANGDFSYRCAIVVKKNNAIIHRESKTFRKKELAVNTTLKPPLFAEFNDKQIFPH